MKPITARVDIFLPQSPKVVFEYFADLRHEPDYNPKVHDVRQMSDGPLGRGTTFEGQHAGLGPVSWTLAEYDPPRHLVVEGKVGSGAYRWVSDLEPAAAGTTLHGRMEWRPGNALRFLSPVLGPLLALSARRSLGAMKEALSTRTGSAAAD